jgi:spore maturation protein CgeB
MMNSTLNISSNKGAEGLELEDGRNIIIANDMLTWVNDILLYLDNDDKRNRIEKNAYELVMKKYYYRHYREELRKIIE